MTEEMAQSHDQAPEIAADKIDTNALWVVRRLRLKGYEAYLTGGCVRDLLLGQTPKDFDVATNAKPEEIKKVFRNCRLIGRRFLLAHIFFPGGKIIETATFRANPTDVAEDVPEDLLVTQDNVYGNIEEDAKRRDLTVNGLFYDPILGKVLDFVGGRDDLEKRLIRTIGDPQIRFREDPVRIIRAIKFACRLGFEIDAATLQAMQQHSSEITRCAPARVQEELSRLLFSRHAKLAFELCQRLGILDALMPELTEVLKVEGEDGEATRALWLSMLSGLDEVTSREAEVSLSVGLACLLLPAYFALEKSEHNERHWIDKLCVTWSERIRLPRHEQDRLRILLSAVHLFNPEKMHPKSAQYVVRKPWFKESLLLYIIYLIATGGDLEQVGLWKALAAKAQRSYTQDQRGTKLQRPRFKKRWPNARNKRRRPPSRAAE